MISVSQGFKTALENGTRDWLISAEITLASGGNPIEIDNDKIWQGGFSLEDAVSADNQFDVGATVVNELQLRLNNMYGDFTDIDFDGATVDVRVGLMVGNEEEYVSKGIYTVYESSYTAETINLVCYDDMIKFDRAITASQLTYPATLRQILEDACRICGPIMSSATFPNETFSVPKAPEGDGITFRELISWAAQIAGCYARVNPSGSLELKWYDDVNLGKLYNNPINATAGSYHLLNKLYSTPNVSKSDVEITRVSVIEDTIDSSGNDSTVKTTFGTDGYALVFEKNGLIQNGAGEEICRYLSSRLIGFKFRKASASIVCDPTIEAGDIALLHNTVKDETFPVIVSRTKFTIGKQDVVSSAMDPQKTGIQRYANSVKNYAGAMWAIVAEGRKRSDLTKLVADTISAYDGEFETLTTNIGNFNLLSTNVIDAILANIDRIEATEIDVDDLQANSLTAGTIIFDDMQGHTASIEALAADYAALKNAAVGQLTAGGATIGDLIATNLYGNNATINVLNATLANITTLLNGNQATENLTSVVLTANNASISWAIIKDLIAEHISAIEFNANTANAVKINTDNIQIGDDDGTFLIDGNTLQVLDDNGVVRIQIGRDANDDYTFTVFDSTGNGVLIDATGIKDGAVANELIVDRMVKEIDTANDYFGISGNKLNINSVVSRLNDNGTNSILATKIYVDEEGQNAALVFSDIRDGVDNNTTAIDVANGKIDKLISSVEIEDIPEGSTMYSQMHHIEETLGGYSETISALETTVNGDDEIVGLVSKVATVENNLNGFQNTVSHTYVTKTDISNPNLVREADLNSRHTTQKGITYEYEGDGWWHIFGTVTGSSAGTVALYGVDSTGNLVTTDGDVCIRIETNVSPLLSGTNSQIQIRYAESSSTSAMSDAFINADGGGINVSVNSSGIMGFGSGDATLDQDGVLHFDSRYVDAGSDGSMTVYSYDDSIVLNRAHNTGCRIAAIRHYIGAGATGQTINGRIRIKVENGDVASGWYPAAEDPRYLAKTSSGTNLAPLFSRTPYTVGDYWVVAPGNTSGYTFTAMGDGWVRVQCDNTSGSDEKTKNFAPVPDPVIKYGTDYTFLYEARNNQSTANQNGLTGYTYIVQSDNGQFWGGSVKKILEYTGTNSTMSFGTENLCHPGVEGTVCKRFVKTSEAEDSTHITGDLVRLFYGRFRTYPGAKLDIEIRISLYEGEYLGDYVPYIDGSATSKIEAVESNAIAAAERIATETLDYGITASDGVIKQYVTNNFVDSTTYNTYVNTTAPSTYASQQDLEDLQDLVDAIEVTGTNLILNTMVPDVSVQSNYPKVRGQTAWTTFCESNDSNTDISVAEHGVKITENNSGTNQVARIYLQFGANTSGSLMESLKPGETYTLSFTTKYKLFSGSPSTSTDYAYEVDVYTRASGASSNTLTHQEVIHSYLASSRSDRGQVLQNYVEATFTVPSGTLDRIFIYIGTSSNSVLDSYYASGDYIELTNLKLESGSSASEWTPAYEDLADTRTYVAQVEALVDDLQDQIDGKIETWFGTVAPTASNAPASDWTTNDLKDAHVGDLYYDRATGYGYSYTKTTSGGTTTYAWSKVDNTSGIQSALDAAQSAQTTADNKITTFTDTPQTSDAYAEGDLWVNATYPSTEPYTYEDDLLICINAKDAGDPFDISDWQLATRYTDDSAANDALDAIGDIEEQLLSVVTIENFGSQIEQNRESIVSTVEHDFLKQETFNALAVGGNNLIINTYTPNTTAAKRPKLIGSSINTAGRGTASTAEHGIRFTLPSASASGFSWPYIRFGTSTVANADLMGLVAGETYTLSFDASWKLLSGGSASNSTEYVLECRIYDNNANASSFSRANANDAGRIIHTFETTDRSDRAVPGTGRLEYTFTVRDNATKIYIDLARLSDDTKAINAEGDFIELRNMKLERGNKASAYSPAPEDLVGEAKTYTNTQYTSTSSQIEQLSDRITNVVSRVDTHDTDFNTLESLVNNSVTEVVVGEQDSATNAWIGTASFKSLTDGKVIIYWLPQDSANNVTLNLTYTNSSGTQTTTGAKNCYFKGNTRLGTQFAAGSQIRMVYRAAAEIDGSTYEGWWSESYADAESTDTYDRLQYKAVVTAGSAISAGKLGVFDSNGYLIPLSTTPFDVSKPILYVGAPIASGSTSTDNYISMGDPFNLRNIKNGFTGTARASVYIVGTLSGTMFTPDSTLITCTKPTQADGKIYILLGLMSSSYYAVLAPEHPMYKYVGGAFKSLGQIAYEAQDDVDNIVIPGENLIRGASIPSTGYFRTTNVTIQDNVFAFVEQSSGDSILRIKSGYLEYGDIKNDQFTLSFEGKIVDDSSGRTTDSGVDVEIGVAPKSFTDEDVSSNDRKYVSLFCRPTSTDWTVFSFTVSIPDDLTSGYSTALIDSNTLYIEIFRDSAGLPFYVRNLKLERGSVATTFSPSPEDSKIYTDTQLTTAMSEITQDINSITLRVIRKPNENDDDGAFLISTINQTAEAITLDASKLNLNGAITANGAFQIKKDGTMIASKGGKIANFIFNDNTMKYHVLASSLQGLNIIQKSDILDVTNSSSWISGTMRISGTGTCTRHINDRPSDFSGSTYGDMVKVILTGTTAGQQMGFCQDNAVLLDHEVTMSVYVKGTKGDRVDLQPFWNSSDSYRVSFTLEQSNVWTRLSCTGTPKKAYSSISIGYVYLVPKTANNKLHVIAPKLEYGTTATAYTLDNDYPTEQEMGVNDVQIGEAVYVGADGISTMEPGSAVSDSIRAVKLNRGAAKFISGDYLEGYISSNNSNDNTTDDPGIGIWYTHSTNKNATGTKLVSFNDRGADFKKETETVDGLCISGNSPRINFHVSNPRYSWSGQISQPNHSGNLRAYPGISNSSDARLKKDIVEMNDGYLDLIDRLEPKEYRFKRNDRNLYLGYVAQDVISALKDLGIKDMPIVGGTGDGEDYYSLDYTQFIPILARKCQKQDEEIRELKSEIEELKNMVKELVQK